MANRRMDPVGYRPFRVEPLLADGLLAVSRPGGELEQRVADGFFNLAAQAGQFADQAAQSAGRAAGLRDALAGGPKGEYQGEVGGAGRVRGAKFSAEVNDAIHQAAVKYGVPEEHLQRFAQIESGGNPKAFNEGSKAAGLFQFIPSTARDYGLTNPLDAYANADAAARLYRDNARHLQAKLGRAPSAGEVYLAHQQGAGGAVNLISNAGRPASAVVGARAVRSNGGTPAMSAGQFANMWIKKVDGGYALPDHPDQITTAAVNSPMTGNVVLAGGRFRPRGSNTIYDRAYDEAGTRTYLQMLETEMRSTTSQAFDLYKDDPAKLASVLGDLRTKIGQDQVFPEIQADYETGFDRLAQTYVEQARDNATKKQEQQDRAEFIGRTGELQTDVARKIEQLDPANPDTANAIASAQAGIDEHYDSAVRRGIMDPDDAARAKLESRRDAAVGFYAKQADALDADGVKAMREKMATDFGRRRRRARWRRLGHAEGEAGERRGRQAAAAAAVGTGLSHQGRYVRSADRGRARRRAGRSRHLCARRRQDAARQGGAAGNLREDLRRQGDQRHDAEASRGARRRLAAAIRKRRDAGAAAHAQFRRGHAGEKAQGDRQRPGHLRRAARHRRADAVHHRGAVDRRSRGHRHGEDRQRGRHGKEFGTRRAS
jgi:hypothetical protein